MCNFMFASFIDLSNINAVFSQHDFDCFILSNVLSRIQIISPISNCFHAVVFSFAVFTVKKLESSAGKNTINVF